MQFLVLTENIIFRFGRKMRLRGFGGKIIFAIFVKKLDHGVLAGKLDFEIFRLKDKMIL